MTPVIQIENVSKLYKLGFYGADTFRDEVLNFFARLRGKPAVNSIVGATNNLADKDTDSDLVWALKDINLTINQGDIVGIIGKNGAGKSTLLKILSKITTPTTGSIKIRGRIASLLEVGTGMHQELTGRENIFLNGAILGMTKQEIKSQLDEIIDFAGIARYIDTPIKRYSSGMRVRLGFAIAAHLDPEILIVDEVLAVGDAEFQKRAIGKMQDISKGEGRTVLFVSHNMASVRNLCKTGVLLENGTTKYIGDINSVISQYSITHHNNLSNDLTLWTQRKGNGLARFQNVYVSNENGDILSTVLTGSNVIFHFDIYVKEKCNVDLGFSFITTQDIMISNLYSSFQHHTFNLEAGKHTISCLVKDFAFSSPELYIRGVINANKQLSDWPSCNLAIIHIEQGNFYGTGVLSTPNNLFLFKGEWNNTIKNE
ncbi:MAG: ABC transporter ATP-binding protein [Bacteroidales bacterium]|nr:ABC transporter ATP-binding protein [Bacteroidales bacterium]